MALCGQVRGMEMEARHIPKCIDMILLLLAAVAACACTYVLDRSIAQSTIT
jgi:hypothetical protein